MPHYIDEKELRKEIAKEKPKIMAIKNKIDQRSSIQRLLHYLDRYKDNKNKLKKYKKLLKAVRLKNWEKGHYKMGEKIGTMFLELTNHIAEMGNFKNYTNIEDMKSEALIRCVQSVEKFDLNKRGKTGQKSKAFSYFSQIIFMCFIQEINKLKKKAKEIPMDFVDTVDGKYFIRNEDKKYKNRGE